VLVALGVSTGLLALVGFLPLFDGPGYEFSVAAGLVLPSAVAIATALEVSILRPLPIDGVARGLSHGAIFAAAAWLVSILHGLRVGFCDPFAGTALFVLGPGIGSLIGGVWGAFVGELASRRTRVGARRAIAIGLGIAGPLGSALISVFRFYTSPMVFAYDPFVGYFSGSFYDTVIEFSGLYAYRAGTAATLVAILVFTLGFHRDEHGKLKRRRLGRRGLVVIGFIAAIASVFSMLRGPRFGHFHTAETIAAELSTKHAALCGEAASCAVQTTLESWLKLELPVELPAATAKK